MIERHVFLHPSTLPKQGLQVGFFRCSYFGTGSYRHVVFLRPPAGKTHLRPLILSQL